MNLKFKTNQFFFYIVAIFLITAGSAFAQSSTASRSDQASLGIEVQAKQAAKLLEILDVKLQNTSRCPTIAGAANDALWDGTGDPSAVTCVDPEGDPTVLDHSRANMPTCAGANEVAFWGGSPASWTCKSLTNIVQSCDVSIDILGECTATGLVQDGSTTVLSCAGATGTCTADVTCSGSAATSTNESCAAPVDCNNAVVGGSGCTSPQFIAHGASDSWVCDGTYVGNCSATCSDGTLSASTNGCVAPPYSNCFDVVGGLGCGTSHTVNHGATDSVACDSGYTGNCTAECDNGTFVNTVNTCVAAPDCAATVLNLTQPTASGSKFCNFALPTGNNGDTTSESNNAGICSWTSAGDAACTGTFSCVGNTWTPTVWNATCGTTVPVYTGTWTAGPCSGACGGGTGTISTSTCSTGNAADCDPATNPDGSACTNSAVCAFLPCIKNDSHAAGAGSCIDSYDFSYNVPHGATQVETEYEIDTDWGSCTVDNGAVRTYNVSCNDGVATETLINCTGLGCGGSGTGTWTLGAYGTCSGACGIGNGTQTASYNCTGGNGICDVPQPADDTRACDMPACATYSWVQSGFGTCSVTCGGGTQSQTVTCNNDSTNAVVADSNCSGAKPATSQTCNTAACATYSWVQSGFGTCSVTCGGGTQSQTVTCNNDSTNAVVADSNCSGAKPVTSQTCNTAACAPDCAATTLNLGPMTTGEWTQSCAYDLPTGSNGDTIGQGGLGSCEDNVPPTLVVSTFATCSGTFSCVANTWQADTWAAGCSGLATTGPWTTGAWSVCDATCGGGNQTRSVTCGFDTCTGPAPASSQTCNTAACGPTYTGTWSGNCNGACGGGAGTINSVTCSTGNFADCDPVLNPFGDACTNSTVCPIPVNGVCGSTTNTCDVGPFMAALGPNWYCLGANGGTTPLCTPAAASVVNGACGTVGGTCSAGTVTGFTGVVWTCSGSGGGTSLSCTTCCGLWCATQCAGHPGP